LAEKRKKKLNELTLEELSDVLKEKMTDTGDE